jgi:hypothetical protein
MVHHTDELLSKSDEDLFTEGGCHVFAGCLADTFAYPFRLLRDTSVPHPKGIVHVYCLPAPDVMIDFRGRRSEHFYLRSRCYDSPPYHAETVSAGRIQEFSVVEFGQGGLYAEPRFLELARRRASAIIAGAKCKYEYVP